MGNKKILLAGGGTAGHVEPALAVARFLRENFPELSIEFLGTSQGLETHLVPAAGFDLKTITKAPFPRKPKPSALMWPFKFLSSIAGTYKALSDVDLLIGFGGYVSSSAYIVARINILPAEFFEQGARAFPLSSSCCCHCCGRRIFPASWLVLGGLAGSLGRLVHLRQLLLGRQRTVFPQGLDHPLGQGHGRNTVTP